MKREQLPKDITLLTKKEACERLKISPATLDRRVAQGRLRVVKDGKLCRFIPSDIDEYIMGCLI